MRVHVVSRHLTNIRTASTSWATMISRRICQLSPRNKFSSLALDLILHKASPNRWNCDYSINQPWFSSRICPKGKCFQRFRSMHLLQTWSHFLSQLMHVASFRTKTLIFWRVSFWILLNSSERQERCKLLLTVVPYAMLIKEAGTRCAHHLIDWSALRMNARVSSKVSCRRC